MISVLTSAQMLSGLKTRRALSLLETMPSVIQIAIYKKLHWVDRGYLALTCKTLASIGSAHKLLNVSIHTAAGVRIVWHYRDAECYEELERSSERLDGCCVGPTSKLCTNCASWKAEKDAKVAESEWLKKCRAIGNEYGVVVPAMTPILGHGEDSGEYSVWQRFKILILGCISCPQCWKVMPYSS